MEANISGRRAETALTIIESRPVVQRYLAGLGDEVLASVTAEAEVMPRAGAERAG